jgi:hypothetical protein
MVGKVVCGSDANKGHYGFLLSGELEHKEEPEMNLKIR